MREEKLIEEGSPCDIDFTDKKIQSVSDAKAMGKVICSNFNQCNKKQIQCYRRVAQQMASYIIDNKKLFNEVVRDERKDFLKMGSEGEFWVFRDNKWQIVSGKENVVDDIVQFAKIIIDLKPGERRPFTQDGMKKPEFGPEDALHNAMLDLDDVYGEVGQKNPFR